MKYQALFCVKKKKKKKKKKNIVDSSSANFTQNVQGKERFEFEAVLCLIALPIVIISFNP